LGNVVRSEFLANCRRCERPVFDDHSHVMVVPVGRGRMFFHAGCEPTNPASDLADAGLRTDREKQALSKPLVGSRAFTAPRGGRRASAVRRQAVSAKAKVGRGIEARLNVVWTEASFHVPETVTERRAMSYDSYNLTRREQDVLGYLTAGKRNREIAAELNIGVATVKDRLSSIYAKLGVSNRTEAAVVVGLGHLPDIGELRRLGA
jgi:DNA-binding CsgD family transcriptional regulator